MDMRFAYQANCWGPLGGHAVGVTSIGQLTYVTFGDMDRAIADIARGRLSGRRTVRRQRARSILAARRRCRSSLAGAGVKLVAAYSGGEFHLPRRRSRKNSARSPASPTRPRRYRPSISSSAAAPSASKACNPATYERLAAGLEKVVAIAKARGLKAHYHPHLTTIVEGPAEVDRIFGLTSIDFCPDTAHLAAAGGDVAAMVRKHRARISYVHLKGLRREPFAFTPLDEGDLDNAPVIRR